MRTLIIVCLLIFAGCSAGDNEVIKQCKVGERAPAGLKELAIVHADKNEVKYLGYWEYYFRGNATLTYITTVNDTVTEIRGI